VAELDGNNRIIGFKEKPKTGEVLSHWVNAGIFLCEARVHQFIPPSQPCDFGHDILPAILSAGEYICGYTLGPGESLLWIDTQGDLARTESVLQEGSPTGL